MFFILDMDKLTKLEAREKIENFFKEIKNKTPKEIKKIKKIAMKNNIPLKDKRKLFCKKCIAPYSGKEKVRINEKNKIIVCLNCDYIARWRFRK